MAHSASVLDRMRLGKQRVEGYQLLLCLTGEGCTGWRNHPAAKMWDGYEFYLAMYTQTMCLEWTRRGYADTILDKVAAMQDRYAKFLSRNNYAFPKHLFTTAFRDSHRSALLRKDFNHYAQYGWNVPAYLPYEWPKPKENK